MGYGRLDFLNIADFSRSVKNRFDFASLGASLKQEGFKMDKVELRVGWGKQIAIANRMRLQKYLHQFIQIN